MNDFLSAKEEKEKKAKQAEERQKKNRQVLQNYGMLDLKALANGGQGRLAVDKATGKICSEADLLKKEATVVSIFSKPAKDKESEDDKK